MLGKSFDGGVKVARKFWEPGQVVYLQTVRIVESDISGHVAVGKLAYSKRYWVVYRSHGRLEGQVHTTYTRRGEAMHELCRLKTDSAVAGLNLSTYVRTQVDSVSPLPPTIRK